MNIDKSQSVNKFNYDAKIEISSTIKDKLLEKTAFIAYKSITHVASQLLNTKIAKNTTNAITGAYSMVSGLTNIGFEGLMNPFTLLPNLSLAVAGGVQLYQVYTNITDQSEEGSSLIQQSNVLLNCAEQLTKEQEESINLIAENTNQIFERIEEYSKKLKDIGEFSKEGSVDIQGFQKEYNIRSNSVSGLFGKASNSLNKVVNLNTVLKEKGEEVVGFIKTMQKSQAFISDLTTKSGDCAELGEEDREKLLKEAQETVKELQDQSLMGLENLLKISGEIQSLLDEGMKYTNEATDEFYKLDKDVNKKLGDASNKFLEIQNKVDIERESLKKLEQNKLELTNQIQDLYEGNDSINEIIQSIKEKNNEISKELKDNQKTIGALGGFIVGTGIIGTSVVSVPTLVCVGAGMGLYGKSHEISGFFRSRIVDMKGLKEKNEEPIFDGSIAYKFDSISSGIFGSLFGKGSSTKGKIFIKPGKSEEILLLNFSISEKNKISLSDIEDFSQHLKVLLQDKVISPEECLDCLEQMEKQSIYASNKLVSTGFLSNDAHIILAPIKKKCMRIIELNKDLEKLDEETKIANIRVEELNKEKEQAGLEKGILEEFKSQD